ncbi:hypothetical protein [Stomatobaculum longum]|uniref:hypothetical protein n=1 Tax=Stomatobaculum longum TaxID=796942 RepID=UPI0009FDC6D9
MREAMQLLADQRLIDIYPGKASIVSPIKQQDRGADLRPAKTRPCGCLCCRA